MFISVALGLIVGGLVFYQQASRSATHQAVVRQLQAVQGELRAMYQVSNWDRLGNTGDSPRLTPVLVHMGAIPQEMVRGNRIFLAHGGLLQVNHQTNTSGAGIRNTHFETVYSLDDVPEWLCTRLVVARSVRGVLRSGITSQTGIIDVGNGVISDVLEIFFDPPGQNDPDYDESLPRRFHRFHTLTSTSAPDTRGDLTPAIAARHCSDLTPGNSTIRRIYFRTLPGT